MWVKGVIIPSITEWEMHITAQGPRLWNDLYCVKWDVKLYYTIPYHEWTRICLYSLSFISECIWVWFSGFFSLIFVLFLRVLVDLGSVVSTCAGVWLERLVSETSCFVCWWGWWNTFIDFQEPIINGLLTPFATNQLSPVPPWTLKPPQFSSA